MKAQHTISINEDMKGFMTKRDLRHFKKAEIKGKNCWYCKAKTAGIVLFISVFFKPSVTSSTYSLNLSNTGKVSVTGNIANYCFN